MVTTRSQKSKEEKPSSPKPIKAEKASTDKKKSQTKQVKNQAKEEKKQKKEPVQNDQKPIKTLTPKAKEIKCLGYTPDQYAKYRELMHELKDKTNDDLKEVLRKNEQKISGSKYELAERVADGIILGAIPKCPSCGGGRPKFDFMKGTYYCPGYRDDVEFVNCHKKYTLAELTRNSWVV